MTDIKASATETSPLMEAKHGDIVGLWTSSKLGSLEESPGDEGVNTCSTGGVLSGDQVGHHNVSGRNAVNQAHKLEKKQSSGDLHSRLKTRKLLGVGETPDGDVHRSKLSQILGHNDQLYTRLPKGVRIWQYANAVAITCLAVMSILLPNYANLSTIGSGIDGHEKSDVGLEALCALRLHGAALAGFSIILWTSVHSVDKDMIRSVALASACYWSLNLCVLVVTFTQLGHLLESAISSLPLRLVALCASLYYCHALSSRDIRRQRSKINANSSTSVTTTSLFDKKKN